MDHIEAHRVYNAERIDTFIRAFGDWWDPDRRLVAYEQALLVTLDRHEQGDGPMAPSGHGWLSEAVKQIDAMVGDDDELHSDVVFLAPEELRRIVNHAVERGHITGRPWDAWGSPIDWSELRITAAGSDLVASGFADPDAAGRINVNVAGTVAGDLAVAGGTAHTGDNIRIEFTPAAVDETVIAVLHRIADLLDEADADSAAEARAIADDPDPTSRRQRGIDFLNRLAVGSLSSGIVQGGMALLSAF